MKKLRTWAELNTRKRCKLNQSITAKVVAVLAEAVLQQLHLNKCQVNHLLDAQIWHASIKEFRQ